MKRTSEVLAKPQAWKTQCLMGARVSGGEGRRAEVTWLSPWLPPAVEWWQVGVHTWARHRTSFAAQGNRPVCIECLWCLARFG